MKHLLTLSALGATAMLSACGSGERGNTSDIVTTNSGNVILNDAQQNYAFTGDNEQVANSMGGSTDPTMNDGAMVNQGAMSNSGGMTNSQ